MNYQLLPNGYVQRSDGVVIPPAAGNGDYQAYQAWVAAGNTATPAPATPVVQSYDTGLGWQIGYDAGTRALLAQGQTLINTMIESLQLAGNTAGVTAYLASNFTFIDINGAPHTVTVQQAMQINLAYGQAYQQIWNAAQ